MKGLRKHLEILLGSIRYLINVVGISCGAEVRWIPNLARSFGDLPCSRLGFLCLLHPHALRIFVKVPVMEPVVVKVTSSDGTTVITHLPPDRPASSLIDTLQKSYGVGLLSSEVDGFGVIYSLDPLPSGLYTYSKIASEAPAGMLMLVILCKFSL